jgi:hypothetical protein
MPRFDPTAPLRMFLERQGRRPVSNVAALMVILGSLIGCVGYLNQSTWIRITALLMWLGGMLSLNGFRRRRKEEDSDHNSPGPGCLY